MLHSDVTKLDKICIRQMQTSPSKYVWMWMPFYRPTNIETESKHMVAFYLWWWESQTCCIRLTALVHNWGAVVCYCYWSYLLYSYEQQFFHEFAFDTKALKTFDEFRVRWKQLFEVGTLSNLNTCHIPNTVTRYTDLYPCKKVLLENQIQFRRRSGFLWFCKFARRARVGKCLYVPSRNTMVPLSNLQTHYINMQCTPVHLVHTSNFSMLNTAWSTVTDLTSQSLMTTCVGLILLLIILSIILLILIIIIIIIIINIINIIINIIIVIILLLPGPGEGQQCNSKFSILPRLWNR